MNLPPDLIALFLELDAARVRYLLVGGHAVAAHGQPRSTKDVDLWLDPSPANIERACIALTRFGAPRGIIEDLRAAGPTDIVWLGRAPMRIDLLQTLPGVEFEDSWGRRITVKFDDVVVPVIGKGDLISNKRAVGRAQDLRDARALSRGTTLRRARSKPKK